MDVHRVFVPSGYIQPCLMFVGKAGAYPDVEHQTGQMLLNLYGLGVHMFAECLSEVAFPALSNVCG